MVFIHELGHFVAAKLNGVEVEVFSLGWGPRLLGFRWRGTMYQVSWFPIGGYCKMKGEMVPGLAGGGAETATPAAPQKGSFLAASTWRRVVIYVFGPLFNLLFAVLVSAVIWTVGFPMSATDTRIVVREAVSANGDAQPFPAARAGLLTGDRIIAINGAPVTTFTDLSRAISFSADKALIMTVQRTVDGATQTLTKSVTPVLDKNTGQSYIGIASWLDPVVGAVRPGGAAAMAGLEGGDHVVRFDGHDVQNEWDIEMAIQSRPSRVEVTVERGGERLDAALVPSYDAAGAADLGFDYVQALKRSPRLGVVGTLRQSVSETWETARDTVYGIGLLFRGINLRNAVAGPLGITTLIGSTTLTGFTYGLGAGLLSFFQLLSLLSVVLFLINLLPIPAMDGGQIVLLVVEIVRRKPARPALVWRLQIIGFTLMLSLFVLVTLNDILRQVGR